MKTNKLCGSRYRDKNGNKITSEELEPLLRDDNYRVVAQDKVGPYFISTVWLGVPYGIREPFDYFETIVFLTPPWEKDPRDTLGKEMDMYRYHNMEEAVMGHYDVIQEWKDRVPTPEELEEATAMQPRKNIQELINEHIKITEDWLSKGVFESAAEMFFAQNMRATIDQYKASKDADTSGDPEIPRDPNAG